MILFYPWPFTACVPSGKANGSRVVHTNTWDVIFSNAAIKLERLSIKSF
jgi:hypothetical protein